MSATVVVVVFGTIALDCSWLPADTPVVVVHNDAALDPAAVTGGAVRHLHPGANLGFGAAVNLAAREARTERLVLVNPDVVLLPEHWPPLADAPADDVVTVPLDDETGAATVTTSRYPGPFSFLLGAWRAGRLAPRGGKLRSATAPAERVPGSRPLAEWWVSGAVCSLDRERFLAVGGFDPGYFLYYEDLDLCRRLADAFPAMRAVLADTAPGTHAVGASAVAEHGTRVRRQRRRSAHRYAASMPGPAWHLAALLSGPASADAEPVR